MIEHDGRGFGNMIMDKHQVGLEMRKYPQLSGRRVQLSRRTDREPQVLINFVLFERK